MDVLFQSIDLGGHPGTFDLLQLFVSALSVLVAGAAAGYAIHDGRRNQRHQEFSEAPAVILLRGMHIDGGAGALLRNVGNGPAIIDEVYVLYRKVPQEATLSNLEPDLSWWDKLKTCIAEKYSNWSSEISAIDPKVGGVLRGEILGSNQTFTILALKAAADRTKKTAFEGFIKNVEVIAFYHSVHGRYFVTALPYHPSGNLEVSGRLFKNKERRFELASEFAKAWIEKNGELPKTHAPNAATAAPTAKSEGTTP